MRWSSLSWCADTCTGLGACKHPLVRDQTHLLSEITYLFALLAWHSYTLDLKAIYACQVKRLNDQKVHQ